MKIRDIVIMLIIAIPVLIIEALSRKILKAVNQLLTEVYRRRHGKAARKGWLFLINVSCSACVLLPAMLLCAVVLTIRMTGSLQTAAMIAIWVILGLILVNTVALIWAYRWRKQDRYEQTMRIIEKRWIEMKKQQAAEIAA